MKTGNISESWVITKEYDTQWWIYKDREAFDKKEGICYIPEFSHDLEEWEEETIHNGTTYTYQDFLYICDWNHDQAQELFDFVDRQHPETLRNEWD